MPRRTLTVNALLCVLCVLCVQRQLANRGPGNPIDIVPYAHKGWEMSEDQKTVTLYLRRGMKWSDGHPYTADDVMFSFEDFILIDEFPSGWHRSGWGPMSHAEKVDDFTVRLHYTDPFPTLPGWYEFWGGWQPHSYPKHYLSKYHAKYNENADALAKEEGYDNWVQAVWQKQASTSDFRVEDLNTPSVNPWNHEEITTTSDHIPRRHLRNRTARLVSRGDGPQGTRTVSCMYRTIACRNSAWVRMLSWIAPVAVAARAYGDKAGCDDECGASYHGPVHAFIPQ